jgi:hypothetical protein
METGDREMKLAFARSTVSMPKPLFFSYYNEKLQMKYEFERLKWRAKHPEIPIRKTDG